MIVALDTSIRYIKGVGETREKLMIKLGIHTLGDLVGYFPRAYQDRTVIKSISELIIGEIVCVRAMAADKPRLSHIRKGLDLTKLRVVDDNASLEITFFNQPFVKDAIKQGETYIFFGKISGSLLRPEMNSPIFERDLGQGDDSRQGDGSPVLRQGDGSPVLNKNQLTGRIIPVYPLTAGLSQKMLMNAVRSGLDKCADELPDVLPVSITNQYKLCKTRFAFENVHFPSSFKELDIARKRLIFEELFVLVTAMKMLREKRSDKTGRALKTPDFGKFYKAFPYKPTNAQIRAINEAAADMASGRPMNRLIQGDVGSGKTLIAAACCWMTWLSGSQSAFMAPTEILAKQHTDSLTELLHPLGMQVGLLTGSMTAKGKRETYEKLKSGEIDLIIGTHALISESVEFKDLALVITDEQHRFGVNQRSLLTEKGDSPHVLVMSATPIPRTLALIIYGDLDVSIVDEMPPGRQEIKTHIVDERHRSRAYEFIKKLAGEGRQVYIICPMVEDDSIENPDESNLKSVKKYYETLSREIFPDLKVELVHGKMPAKKKDAAMSAFASGDADILVATTVVEVGVDVPNAALIIIENADRFGLSQLHQLRGRVGRGRHESHCVLFRSENSGEISIERLNVMRATNDGFKIAEEDLKLRGPGDFFGSKQHGLPEMHIANFATDMLVLNQAQNAAHELLEKDPALKAPENRKLKNQIERLFELSADKMN
ncbi:MAG: ATP-dependent DNA helicase RecG [Oscillospiraceae bacterium]|nr:ATP-dependent DNA helicase RecG [Oscillospiraceae bacterium]